MAQEFLVDPPADVEQGEGRVEAPGEGTAPNLVEVGVGRARQDIVPGGEGGGEGGDPGLGGVGDGVVAPGQRPRADRVIGAQGGAAGEVAEPPGECGERGRLRLGVGALDLPATAARRAVALRLPARADAPAGGHRLPQVFLVGEPGEAGQQAVLLELELREEGGEAGWDSHHPFLSEIESTGRRYCPARSRWRFQEGADAAASSSGQARSIVRAARWSAAPTTRVDGRRIRQTCRA